MAPVQLERKWGFIDSTGNLVIKPRFQAAAAFSDGLARFQIWDAVQCDASNHAANRPETFAKENAPLDAFTMYRRDRQSRCFAQDVLFGYIDTHGQSVIAPTLPVAEDFSEGLAAVRLSRSPTSKWGYIDKSGRIAIQPRFDQALSFSEGRAAVQTGFRAEQGQQVDGKWGFIDALGRFDVPPQFDLADGYSEGLAAVFMRSDGWGYIDALGTFAIPPRYTTAGQFSEGVAVVDDGVENYYIDKAGRKVLVLKTLLLMWPFSDGLTVAGNEGEQKYVDRKGRTVANYASPF